MGKNLFRGVFIDKSFIEDWVYYVKARDVMSIFWYKKWERFNWVIEKIIKSDNLENDFDLDKDIIKQEKKQTWWRPRIDYLLTYEACFLIVSFMDPNKKEFIYLRDLFSSTEANTETINLEEKKSSNINKKEDNISINKSENIKNYSNDLSSENLDYKKYFFITVFLFILFFLYFIFDKLGEKSLSKDIIVSDISEENWIEKLSWSNNKVKNEFSIEDKIKDFYIWKSFDYLDDEFKENLRTDFSKNLSAEDLLKSYFIFWNLWLYKDACSLLKINKCNSYSKSFYPFYNFWEDTKSGYKIKEIYKVEWNYADDWYCIKTEHKLKDSIGDIAFETIFRYSISQRKDWFLQIDKRLCERKTRDWKTSFCGLREKDIICDK